MRGCLQETAGELTAEKAGTADEKRRGRIGPPGVVRPEVLDTRTVDRHLVQAERSDVEDVIQVTGVAHAEVDEQVVHQHPQQHAIDQAQYINACRLFFHVGMAGPQADRRLDRTLALEPQIHRPGLGGGERDFEQVIVLANLPAGEGQRVARTPDQAVGAVRVGQIELKVIEGWIGQFEQPVARGRGRRRAIVQIDTQPERRRRVTGIEDVARVRAKLLAQHCRRDLLDGGIAFPVFEYLHHSAQGKVASGLVEIDRTGQHRQQARQ
ncbi:hypothetical protein D9M71_139690 [compost metagenome]